MLAEALRDASALDAFVFAYEELPSAERRAMVEAVVQDAELPAPALAALLLAETNPSLRARIAEHLHASPELDFAWVSGTDAEGEALLRDVDPGGCQGTLRIAWADYEIRDLAIKPGHGESFSGRATRREDAMALVAPMLWRYLRRGGSVPPGVQHFARYF